MHLDPEQHQMTAIVLAGDRTKADSLINHSKAGSKAMIDLDGMPMVRRVLNALRSSRVVNRIALCGPEASEIAKDDELAKWADSGEVIWSEPGISPSTSAYQAMKGLGPEEAVLLTTADHPLLTAEIVDAFGRQSLADDVDVAVGLAPHALVLEAYPGIKKTVLHFSDGDFLRLQPVCLYHSRRAAGRALLATHRATAKEAAGGDRPAGLVGGYPLSTGPAVTGGGSGQIEQAPGLCACAR